MMQKTNWRWAMTPLLVGILAGIPPEQNTPSSPPTSLLQPASTASARLGTPGSPARLQQTYARLPLRFEANRGQTAPQVDFLARGNDYSLFLTPQEAVFSLRTPLPQSQTIPPQSMHHISSIRHSESRTQANKSGGVRLGGLGFTDRHFSAEDQPNAQRPTPNAAPKALTPSISGRNSILRMQLAGARPHVKALGQNGLPGTANYFRGQDPKHWLRDVPAYGKVRYNAVYPNVDLVYYGNQQQLEYDFVVQPGGDPHAIGLKFAGARQLTLDATGNLQIGLDGGRLTWHKPSIYQEVGGKRREIAGRYVLRGKRGQAHQSRLVGFEVADYDTHRPLIIDPTLLYSTFLGGSGKDVGYGIAVDNWGNAYVTGYTNSPDFPVVAGSLYNMGGGSAFGFDAFVTKINAAGTALVYSTYLGGFTSAADYGTAIAIDSGGNAYVTGSTASSDFPVTPGAMQGTYGGGSYDVFVAKLNPTGSSLVYATYLGGRDEDTAYGIAVDPNGNAFVTGSTLSTNYPTTASAVYLTGGGATYGRDAFVTELNAAGTATLYSTFLRGSGNTDDFGYGIALDGTGKVYVTGYTTSPDLATTANAFQKTFGGGSHDGFVAKIDPTQSGTASLVYLTYLGGSGDDGGKGIAVDGTGNAYITGFTNSANYPTTPGALLTTGGGTTFRYDAFVTKLNPAGSALVYSTYLGGSKTTEGFPSPDDFGNAIAIDSSGNAYVTGSTASSDFPTTKDAFHYAFLDPPDAFFVRLNASGSQLLYSTYLGGNGTDVGNGIAVDLADNAYLTGSTTSPIFPTTNIQRNYGGNDDAFIAKFGAVASDFDGDNFPDLVFQNSTTGQVAFWYMETSILFPDPFFVPGTLVAGGAMVPQTPNAGDKIVGVGDFNGDGHPDLVFQNSTTGRVFIWYMDGTTLIGGEPVSVMPATGYRVVGVGDFNGDGHPDLVFQNSATGQIILWYLNGATFLSGAATSLKPQTGYQAVGVGDFNGDGHPDLVFQNSATGRVAVWYMNGPTVIGGDNLSPTPASGYLAKAVGDFNGDGFPDIVFQHSSTGQVVFWFMQAITVRDSRPATSHPDPGWQLRGPR